MSERFAVNIFHFITRVTPYFWHMNVRFAAENRGEKQNLRPKQIENLGTELQRF